MDSAVRLIASMKFPTDLKLDPVDIEERGVLRDDVVNKIRSRVGILLSIYFLEGWRPEKRRALLQNLEDYLFHFGENVSHYQIGYETQYHRWNGNGLPVACFEHIDSITEADTFAYSMMQQDSSESDDPSLFQIFAFGFGKDRTGRPLSGLKAHFPPSFVFANPDRFVDLVRTWSDRVGAVHGSAGLGALSVPGSETTEDAYYYPWLMQYPALEYDAMGDYWSEIRKGGYKRPRSSNWLTILGRDNVKALGGEGLIRTKLTPDMSIANYRDGIVIRAGKLPALGDQATGGIPEAYRTVARIIKPIRFEEYRWSIIKLPPHLNTGREARLAETMKWIRRFD
jgi:hypothetical protein